MNQLTPEEKRQGMARLVVLFALFVVIFHIFRGREEPRRHRPQPERYIITDQHGDQVVVDREMAEALNGFYGGVDQPLSTRKR